MPRPHLGDERKRHVLREPGKGKLGLVADPNGWSYPDGTEADEDDASDLSLVALIRKPRMIVEYFPVARGPTRPIIRGVFIADDSIDGLLRKTEPKGHDQWDTTTSGDTPIDAVRTAVDIKNKIKRLVARFRTELKPSPKPPEKVSLPEWDRIMRALLTGNPGPIPPPPHGHGDFIIQDTPPMLSQCGEHSVSVRGEAKVRLRKDYPFDECEAVIAVKYVLKEEGGGGEEVNLKITLADDSVAEGNAYGGRVYAGPMTRSDEISFTFESEPYSSLCTGEVVFVARARSKT